MKKHMIMVSVVLLLSGCVAHNQRSVVQESASGISGLQVIGQAEYVTVLPANYRYQARIDSGATTCSMSALDIEQFERDGEKWVRFRLPIPSEEAGDELQKSDPMEYPISRIANIKRHGAEDQIRPAVKMTVRLGRFEDRVEFTLTDRTKYEFPILVGRNLLEGHAVVDVSQSYVAEEK
jgi:hypothetical protein